MISVTVKFKQHCHAQWKFSFRNTAEATVCMRAAHLWFSHKFILCII